jgi:hypothetical protein
MAPTGYISAYTSYSAGYNMKGIPLSTGTGKSKLQLKLYAPNAWDPTALTYLYFQGTSDANKPYCMFNTKFMNKEGDD